VSVPLEEPVALRFEETKPEGAFYALCLFVFLGYAVLPYFLPFLRPFRIVLMVAVVALFMAYARRAAAGERVPVTRPQVPLFLGYIVVTLVLAPLSLSPGTAFATIQKYLGKLLAVVLLVSIVVRTPGQIKGLLWVFVLSTCIPCIGGLVWLARGIAPGGRAGWVGLYGGNELAAFAVMVVPAALILVARTRNALGRLVPLGCLVLFTVTVFRTASRGGLLALGMVLLLQAFFARRKIFALGAVAVAVMLAPMVMPGLMRERFERMGRGAEGRMAILRRSMDLVSRRPIRGWGYGTYFHASMAIGGPWKAPHNTFVRVMVESGLIGFGFFGAFFYTSLRDLFRIQRQLRRSPHPSAQEFAALARGLFLALVNLAVSSISCGYTFFWQFYAVLGLSAAVKSIYQEQLRRTPAQPT